MNHYFLDTQYHFPTTDVGLLRARTTTTPSTGARPPISFRWSPSPQRSSCPYNVSSLSLSVKLMHFVSFLMKTDEESLVLLKTTLILCPVFEKICIDITSNTF